MTSNKEIANLPPVDPPAPERDGSDRRQEAPEGPSGPRIDVDLLAEAIKKVYKEVTEKEEKLGKEHKKRPKKRKAEQTENLPSESKSSVPLPKACSICKLRLDEPAGMTEPIPKRPRLQDRPNPNDSPLRVGPCGHIFHKVCINQWFAKTLLGVRQKPARTAACPVCNRHLRSASLYPIVLKFHADADAKDPKKKDESKTKTNSEMQKSIEQMQKNYSSLLSVIMGMGAMQGGPSLLAKANSGDSDSDWSMEDEDEDKQ